jgi:alpha-maltose-1-phosphate synthase
MKSKICILNFWPKGGMRHYTDSIVQILKKRWDIVYITNYDSGFDDVRQYIYNFNLNIFNVSNYVSLIRILKILFITKPEHIHINSGHPILLLLYPFLLFRHSIITIHDAKHHEGETSSKAIYLKIQLLFIALFIKKIIVHSDVIREQLPFFLNRKPVFIIPHVNYKLHSTADPALKTGDENFTLLFFGRIMKYKGLKYLLEAFNQLGEKYCLIIAGEGRLPENIPKSDRIEIKNRFIENKEMQNLFLRADALVLPYIAASQSGVIYMAYAFNKPVIATKVGAIPDVVKDQHTGLLVRPKDPAGLVHAIKQLHDDHYLYSMMVENIKKENISSDDMMNRYFGQVYAGRP